MARSERLFELLQALRRHRRPVTGQALADEIGVSLRTLYRDIASLQSLGATIEGEAGIGYILKPGFLLPPLMFTFEEIEALVLGSRWVADRADAPLRAAARSALDRIAAVLPGERRGRLDDSALLVAPGFARLPETVELPGLRDAINAQCKLTLSYRDEAGILSKRIVWPFALAYFDAVRVLLAWCEMRKDFRHFRTDRIASAALGSRYPKPRQVLLAEWEESDRARSPRRKTADGN